MITDRDLELLTPKDASKILGLNVKSFFQLPIPFVLLGKRKRYRRDDLAQYIKDNSYSPINDENYG